MDILNSLVCVGASLFLLLAIYYKEKPDWRTCLCGPMTLGVISLLIPFLLVHLRILKSEASDNVFFSWYYLLCVIAFALPRLLFKANSGAVRFDVKRVLNEREKIIASWIVILAVSLEVASSIVSASKILSFGISSALSSHGEFYNTLNDRNEFLEYSLPVRFVLNTLNYSGAFVVFACILYYRQVSPFLKKLMIFALLLFGMKSMFVFGRGLMLTVAGIYFIMSARSISKRNMRLILCFTFAIFFFASIIKFSSFSEGSMIEGVTGSGITGVAFGDFIPSAGLTFFWESLVIYLGHAYTNFCHYYELFGKDEYVGGMVSVRGFNNLIAYVMPSYVPKMEANMLIQEDILVHVNYIATQWGTAPGAFYRDFGPVGGVVCSFIQGVVFLLVSIRSTFKTSVVSRYYAVWAYFFALQFLIGAMTGFYLGILLVFLIIWDSIFKS